MAQETGQDVADRLAAAVNGAIDRLAALPGVGTPVQMVHPDLTGLRKGKVAGFARLLVIYRVVSDQLEVVRVLHGSQDWE